MTETKQLTPEEQTKAAGLEAFAVSKMNPQDGQKHNNALFLAKANFEKQLRETLQLNAMYQYDPNAAASGEAEAVKKKSALDAEIQKHMKTLDEQIVERTKTGGLKQGDPDQINGSLGKEKEVARGAVDSLLGMFLGPFAWIKNMFSGIINGIADMIGGYFSPGSVAEKEHKKTAAGVAIEFAERPIIIEGVAFQPDYKALYNQALGADFKPPAVSAPQQPNLVLDSSITPALLDSIKQTQNQAFADVKKAIENGGIASTQTGLEATDAVVKALDALPADAWADKKGPAKTGSSYGPS